jgi:hypothetical protein
MTITDADNNVHDNLVSYATAGTGTPWMGSTSQLQTKSAGAAHLILGSPEYQFV